MCLLASRLWSYIRQVPEFADCRASFWTDSAIVLHWIFGDTSRWETFVSNRVADIQQLSRGCPWQHCVSAHSPADLLTRGESAVALTRKTIWWAGPPWLGNSEKDWPNTSFPLVPAGDLSPELSYVCPAGVVRGPEPQSAGLFDLEHYSRLSRLLRITAWVMRFHHNAVPSKPSASGRSKQQKLRRQNCTGWDSSNTLPFLPSSQHVGEASHFPRAPGCSLYNPLSTKTVCFECSVSYTN